MTTAEFWEPWTPKVGDRVRVRLSGECRLKAFPNTPAEKVGMHRPEEDGRIGTVADFWSLPQSEHPLFAAAVKFYAEQGHCYDVIWDEPFSIPDTPYRSEGEVFAAAELEPLDSES